MPITYERDDARRRIIVTLAGAVTLEDLLGIVDRQASEGAWACGLLYDARRVAKEQAGTPEEVRRVFHHVSAHASERGPRGPVAIVTDNPADYALLRIYSTRIARAEMAVEVFRDPGDAERWLALNDRVRTEC
jgi:hypothetical protein